MGKTALRLIAAALVGLAVSLGGLVIDSEAPNNFNPAVWGLIVAAVKYAIDYLVSLKGPAPEPTESAKRYP